MAEQPTVNNLYEEPGDKRNHEKFIAAVAYLPFGFVATMLSGEQSPFVQTHMKQGAIVFVAYVFFGVVLPGGLLAWFALGIFLYAPAAAYYGYNAFQGETKLLPYIGEKL
jgi:ABC-type multidrug transport system permease subunit